MQSLFIIKIGGNIIDDEVALAAFLSAVASISTDKIIIHGGGKIATRIGDALQITSKYENGRRITDDATLDLVTMVYGGLVNKKIVAGLQALGCNAIGLTGADANLIPANKRPVTTTNYGWAGDIIQTGIGVSFLQTMLTSGLTPVFAPLTHDGQGHMLNTNADTIASALAIALSTIRKVRLVYCFEKKGILRDVNDNQSVIKGMNKATYQNMRDEGLLIDGIIPKIDNALAAVSAGVEGVVIGHAQDLLQNIGQNTEGTLIQ